MARMDARPLEDFTMWAMLQDMGQCFEPDVLEDLVRQWIQTGKLDKLKEEAQK